MAKIVCFHQVELFIISVGRLGPPGTLVAVVLPNGKKRAGGKATLFGSCMLIPTWGLAAQFTRWEVSELGFPFPKSPRLISKSPHHGGPQSQSQSQVHSQSSPTYQLQDLHLYPSGIATADRRGCLELVSNHPSTLPSASTYLNAWAPWIVTRPTLCPPLIILPPPSISFLIPRVNLVSAPK